MPKETKLLPLSPPDHDTNTQACLAATQTPSGTKSEEIEDIDRASMEPVEVKSIGTTYTMVVLRSEGLLSRTLLIIVAASDTVQQRKILLIQQIKANEM